MKNFLLAMLLLFSMYCTAQIKFEKGYFIDNDGNKTECLIRNVDWRDNPSKFSYKISEDSESMTAQIDAVQEFGILNDSKYKRFKVNIDRSSDDADKLSSERNPIFEMELLFLKVLVEGEGSLYSYVDNNLHRFFYETGNQEIEQLIYKSYVVAYNKIRENNRYQQQLLNSLKCDDIGSNDIARAKYDRNDLRKIFIAYNKCNDPGYSDNGKNEEKGVFHLSVRPGIDVASLSIQSSIVNTRDFEFDSELIFRIGLELEYVFPFNKSKWALFAEPIYQSYTSETTNAIPFSNNQEITADVSYSSLRLSFGVRHYFFLNDTSKLFLNGGYSVDLNSNPEIDFTRTNFDEITTEGRPSNNVAVGFGYNYNNKLLVEFRYNIDRDIIGDPNGSLTSDYSSLSAIFGYTLF